jgi:hypothetical protein
MEMNERKEEIFAKILNLCESDPDAGLEFIEQTIKKKPGAESDPFGKFAKAIAYGSKGLFQLARSKPGMDFTSFDEEELRDDLGITDAHLDCLEKGLQEIKEMEEIRPGALKMFGTEEDRMGELKVDAMAMVLERCRPGRVQQILGKTKLYYFGPRRVVYPSDLSSEIAEWPKVSLEDFKIFSNILFSFHTIVRTAIIMDQGRDSKGRKYIRCTLCKRTPNNPAPGETLSEMLEFKGGIYLFDDGTFGDSLPEERGEKAKDELDRQAQPKKKGLFGKLFG